MACRLVVAFFLIAAFFGVDVVGLYGVFSIVFHVEAIYFLNGCFQRGSGQFHSQQYSFVASLGLVLIPVRLFLYPVNTRTPFCTGGLNLSTDYLGLESALVCTLTGSVR